eukprot:CFRG5997T1
MTPLAKYMCVLGTLLPICDMSITAAVVNQVVVVGIDGLGASKARELLELGLLPNIAELRDNGVYTMKCRGDFPTSSATNWHAIISATSSELTGVDSNHWRQEHPSLIDVNGLCHNTPTIFSLLKSQQPESQSALITGWDVLLDVAYPKSDITHAFYEKSAEKVMTRAINLLNSTSPPQFTMLQIDEVDKAGHASGYGNTYNDQVRMVDTQIGRFIGFLKTKKDFWKHTLLMLVADHGRQPSGYDHGGLTQLELETMWIAVGAGVDRSPTLHQEGRQLITPIRSMDTAATAAYALGLNLPVQWRGHPVREVFNASSFGFVYVWPSDTCDAKTPEADVIWTHQISYVLGLWNGVVLTLSGLGLILFLLHAIAKVSVGYKLYMYIGCSPDVSPKANQVSSMQMSLLTQHEDEDEHEEIEVRNMDDIDCCIDEDHKRDNTSFVFNDPFFWIDCVLVALCLLGLNVVIPTMIRVI